MLSLHFDFFWRVLLVLKIDFLIPASAVKGSRVRVFSAFSVSDQIASTRGIYRMGSLTNSERQTYHTQIMNQQAQALDALQKVAKLEEGIDSNQANGNSNGQVVPVSHNEVCTTVPYV